MTKKLEMYKCNVCGNLIQILTSGNGDLVCCGENMQLLIPHNQEEMKGEFHIPVVLKDENDNKIIQVGQEKHPMTHEHHIEFIQVISECRKKIFTQFLDEEQEPNIEMICAEFGKYSIKENCNIHGLWENNYDCGC